MLSACDQTEVEFQNNPTTPQTRSEYFVTGQEAIIKANKHYAETFGITTRAEKEVASTEYFKLSPNDNEVAQKYGFYIINYKDNKGFAMVSADTRRPAVFAISDTGTLNSLDTLSNIGLSWYMNKHLPILDKYFTTLYTMGLQDLITNETTITICNPLLKGILIQFGTYEPYNKYCFTPEGMQSIVGCAPLAVGTLCGYYQHPTKIGNLVLDWSTMLSNANHDSWAKLFLVIGKDYMDAEYTPDNASVYPADIPYAINSIGFQGASRKTFSLSLLSNELSSKNPVLLGGDSV